MRPTEGAGPASRATVAARLLVVPRVGSFENAARSFAGGTPHPRLDTDRETDSEQVPRGKVEKHSEKRVKENAKPSEVAPEQACGRVCVRPRLVATLLSGGVAMHAGRRKSRRARPGSKSRRPRSRARVADSLGARRGGRRPGAPGSGRGSRARLFGARAGVGDPVDLAPTTRLETRTEESDACASRWLAERQGYESRNAQRRRTTSRAGRADREARAAAASRVREPRRSLDRSARDRTRKMVNYAWAGRSRTKARWRAEAVLTCKSIARPARRGERPIEPSDSWFPPKFPSG